MLKKSFVARLCEIGGRSLESLPADQARQYPQWVPTSMLVTEPTINDALADLLREMRKLWRSEEVVNCRSLRIWIWT
jgi:hypothetical protein